MWFTKLFTVFSSLYAGVTASNTVDYSLTYIATGNNISSSQIFSTAFDNNHILREHSSISDCQIHCANTTECLGFVEFEEEGECVILDNLGVPIISDDFALSFTKVSKYEYRDNHTIYGEVFNSYPEDDQKIHTFYLDLNRNGLHDEGEPINYTTVNSNVFEFTNVLAGNYLIREIPNDNCVQLWPGAWGYNDANIRYGNGFVDSVVQYFHNGHPDTIDLNGGVITNELLGDYTAFSPAPVSLILGNSPTTFISFPAEHGIIFEFLDDVIVNNPGNDIAITTFLNSTVDANVFVSSNNIDYYKIGILNNTQSEFDLMPLSSQIDHVSFIKLEFYLNNESDSTFNERNIISIEGLSLDKYFAPAYSAFVTVPQDYNALFVKDCNYTYTCYTYCLYTRTTFDTVDSCMVGCDLWEDTGTCDCNGAIDRGIPFYGETYQKNDCDDGCLYKINYEVFPEYAVKLNASGRLSRITSMIQCKDYDLTGLDPNGCIKDILSLCSRQPSCDAVSLANHSIGYLYDDEFYIDQLDSYFIVKRKKLGHQPIENLRYSTPTTTPSTTVSTTASTTATTSQTSTVSTTPSSTPSSTPTTTIKTNPSKSVLNSAEVGLLVTLLVFLLFIVLLLFLYCRKKRATHSQKTNTQSTLPHENYHTDYNNPVYDVGMGISPKSSTSRISNTSPHRYLDIEPQHMDSTYFEVSTVKQESEL